MLKDMLGREAVVTVEDARKKFFEHWNTLPPQEEICDINDALNRVISRDIIAPVNLPEFSRSTVDGYALRAEDTFGASETLPAYLALVGEIKMGEYAGTSVKRGEVVKIATGGMLPEGANAVAMFEYCTLIGEKTIEVVKAVAPGENVIQIGEDIQEGTIVLIKKHRLRPQDIGALAGIGITKIHVYKKPLIAIISTGNEIIPATQNPRPGQIRDINLYNLAGLITMRGCIPVKKGIFPDEYTPLRSIIEESLKETDMVIITGGSSVGAKDLTARIINDIGVPGVLIHGVALKPGKPTIIGIVNNKPIFGLPGHPAAVTVCFDLFIRPALRVLTGKRLAQYMKGRALKRVVRAKFSRNLSSSPGREDHIRVALEEKEGALWAKPILGKSGLITTLVKAIGVVVIPINKLGLEAGEEVEVRLFD